MGFIWGDSLTADSHAQARASRMLCRYTPQSKSERARLRLEKLVMTQHYIRIIVQQNKLMQIRKKNRKFNGKATGQTG